MNRQLFSELRTADLSTVAKRPDHGAVRHRRVGLNLDLLQTNVGPLDVSLFDGNTVVLDVDHIEHRGNDCSWHGRVKGFSNSHALISVVNGNVAGTIIFGPKDRYQVMSQADGSTLLRQIEESAFPPDHPPEYFKRLPKE